MVETIHIITLLTLIVSICLFYIYRASIHPNECNMNIAENRDFNKFYGIGNSRNHFTITTADACDSDIIIQSVLLQAVLKADKSASSFIVAAKFGTGKTLLRCEYFKSLKSNRYFKILLLNKHLNEYLQRFVSETSTEGRNCETKHCLIGWSKTEFAQLLLSMLATQFVDQYEKEKFDLSNVSVDERVEVIRILCYYYNGHGVQSLEKVVNLLLNKSSTSMYSARKAQVRIIEQNKSVDKPLLTHFKKDLKKFTALDKDYQKLELLLAVVEGENFQQTAMETTMFDSILKHLTYFTVFIKTHLNKSVVFIVDGINENQYFYRNNFSNKESWELFLRSSISAEIQSTVMAQNFYLSLFYPEIDGIDIEDMITRPDKFPTYRIEWNTRSLINYADYVLKKMNRSTSTIRCKSLTNIETLINYSHEDIAKIFNRISTPRQLHYFLIELISEMNTNAKQAREPFIATLENVQQAFKRSIKYLHRGEQSKE